MYLPELQIHQNRSALFATRCRSPDEEVETRIRVRKDKLVEALNNENVHISKITVELEPGRKILNSDKLPISRKVMKHKYYYYGVYRALPSGRPSPKPVRPPSSQLPHFNSNYLNRSS